MRIKRQGDRNERKLAQEPAEELEVEPFAEGAPEAVEAVMIFNTSTGES